MHSLVCKEQKKAATIYPSPLIDIIENCSNFFVSHNKNKYLIPNTKNTKIPKGTKSIKGPNKSTKSTKEEVNVASS